MKLPIPFINGKKDANEYYLALLLTDEKSSAVILKEHEGKIKIIGTHEEFFTTPLESLSQNELIDLVDKTISRAEEILPPNIETHKTVFGVKGSWVDEETKKIGKEKLAQLKKVSEALDLTPIGFMVITEAIAHLLQEEEGAPLSAILAEIGKKSVTLTLLRGGKAVETITGPLGHFSPPAAIDSLLKHFTIEVLPARIILSHSEKGDELSQEFISHQWNKSLPFLHMPQITVLQSGFDARAVAFGAAAQMGFEILDATTPHTQVAQAEAPAKEAEEEKDEVVEDKEPDEAKHSEEALPATAAATVTADNFGFVTDEDIAGKKRPVQTTEEIIEHAQKHAVHTPEPHVTHHKTHDANVEPVHLIHHTKHVADLGEEEPEDGDSPSLIDKMKAMIPAVSLPAMKGFSLPSGRNKKLLIPLGIVVGLVLLVVGLSFAYLYKAQATIILAMEPKVVDQTEDVTFSTTSASDYSQNVVAAKTITVTVEGELAADATGKKEVGEKAKGSITLYNNDNESTSLSSGTTIKASGGQLYTLDKDITIASASGDIFSGTKPGTTDASVTAKEIGTDYNVSSGTKFSIGSNATLAGKNDSAFTGGTKKSITVVSKEDQEKLKAALPKSLEDKAKEAIKEEVASDETILPNLTNARISKATFDKGVDDEAKKVKLKASVSFDGTAYKNDELESYAKALLKSKYAQDMSFADNSVKGEITTVKETDSAKEVIATVRVEGGLVPNVNTDDILRKVEGKSLAQAKDAISEIPQVATSQITFSPNIPFLPSLFPRLPNTINVQVKSNE